MPVMGVSKFERFFRVAASLDVDKADLKRYQDFVYQKVYDLLLIGQASAKANQRDVLEPWDLPITKGLQELMHEFRGIDAEIELGPILENLAARPPLDVALSEGAQARLVPVVGGVSLALTRTFKIVDPDVKNPTTDHWDRVARIFDLLL
jgi:hypothetical protein